jgi:hypothetical protein
MRRPRNWPHRRNAKMLRYTATLGGQRMLARMASPYLEAGPRATMAGIEFVRAAP